MAGIQPATLASVAIAIRCEPVCICYPDMPAMLGAAASLAGRTVGVIIPRGTRLMRFGVGVANLIQRLRRHPFRIYVHDPDEVEAVLAGHGLSRRYLRDGLVWRVMVLGR